MTKKTPDELHRQRLLDYIEGADEIARNDPAFATGWLVLYHGASVGWISAIKKPEDWISGCIAIPRCGAIFMAATLDGSHRWELLATRLPRSAPNPPLS